MKHVTFVEHYPDPTASEAELREERQIDKMHKTLINCIMTLCDLCGFEVCGRIWLKHKATGKEYP